MTIGEELVLTARWVFPVNSPPLKRGTITIRGNKIAAIAPAGVRDTDLDLGNAAIIPGLVNAHTHLDLSGLAGMVPPGNDLPAWLKSMIAFRRQQAAASPIDAINGGLTESLRFGTTLLGDISSGSGSWPVLREAQCWSVVFHEVLGLPAERVMPAWQAAARWLNENHDTDRCRAGLSPHAPYSVHHDLFRAAGSAGVPLAIHFMESPDEQELLREHGGPLASFLREVGAFDADGLVPSHEWALWRSERAPALLLIHGNYLPPTTPLPAHASVVYCPRTHAAFGHPPHAFRELLKRGVRVALGTDSLASNPDLDVWQEALFIHEKHPDLAASDLLRMATLSGAEALNAALLCGSLEAGKSADLVVIPLPDREAADPHDLLFDVESLRKPRRTMWRGQWRTPIS